MAISRLGNYNAYGVNGGFLNYQASINQLKLQQALGKNGTKYGLQGSIGNILGNSLSGSTSYVNKYNSAMTDLLSAANSLRESNSSGVFSQKTATSSDENILSAANNYKLTGSDSYAVSVSQVAMAQVNQSTGVESIAKASGNASFNILTDKGSFDINVSATKTSGVAKSNKELLNDIASAINGKKAGVTASVVEENGKSSLKITGNETGQGKGFTVSGTFAQQNGLTSAVQNSQDAVYSVRKNNGPQENYTSASNKINIDGGKIAATIKTTGDVTIANGTDSSKITDAVSKLVDSYNKVVNLLTDNKDRGSGTARQLQAMMASPASKRSLALIGISQKDDGTLSVDKDKLTAALRDQPELAKDIIGGSFGLAQGAYNKAQSGMAKSSSSLINNDIKVAQKGIANDPTSFLAHYSRSGAYNVMNYYAVGMMMNFTV